MTAPARRPGRVVKPLRRRTTLLIPLALAATLTASASGFSVIHVRSGDTLSALALRYHTTVAALIALNHLPGNGDLIFAGQTLRIPRSGAARGGGTSTTIVRYTVRRGDTVSGIAARFHVSATRIARRNHLPSSLMIIIGQRLVIRHRTTHTSTGTAPPTGGLGTAAARHDRAVLAHRGEPSRSEVASMIRSTASRWGLDPRLALAISYQESGFNMRVVSGVDAVGAMQIMPYTGTYLSDDVLHRHLDLGNAQDNITAGVALLALLVHESHSERLAAAGYYQGLQSVRDHGMFADTLQYVGDVLALRQRF
jgi:N-acetylmuramoyl-L-alanine amidase